MDIIQILKSIQKLKAGLAASIAEKQDVIKNTKEIYYSNLTIYSDEEKEKMYKKKNKFYEFLEQDDIDMIRDN